MFTDGHHFTLAEESAIDDVLAGMTAPLSVILQVTKRCDFDCSFCSEILQLPDPTIGQLDTMRANLAGVRRVFLSGGEPLMRRDFGEVIDLFSDEFILGIPTNATRARQHAPLPVLLVLDDAVETGAGHVDNAASHVRTTQLA